MPDLLEGGYAQLARHFLFLILGEVQGSLPIAVLQVNAGSRMDQNTNAGNTPP